MLKKPLLLFDADCGFCRRWIGRWQQFTGDRVEYAPFQSTRDRYPDIPPENFALAARSL
jgi:lipase maturation factor 1